MYSTDIIPGEAATREMTRGMIGTYIARGELRQQVIRSKIMTAGTTLTVRGRGYLFPAVEQREFDGVML